MMVYIAVVLVCLVYIWKKGVIDWAQVEKVSKTLGIPSTPDFRPAEYVGTPAPLPIGISASKLDELERSVK